MRASAACDAVSVLACDARPKTSVVIFVTWLKPKVIVTLGATAALGVLNRKIAVSQERGRPMLQPDGTLVLATVHPAWLLRIPDEASRIAERDRMIDDLRRVRAIP